jgi:23S rRNA (pseudouridine1915-N3)-methyltransferase
MAFTVVCVGKIKEEYIKKGIEDYAKRIARFTKLTFIEVPDENCGSETAVAVRAEGEKILEKIPQDSYNIVLDIGGKQLDSMEFAAKIEHIFTSGKNNICFIIGGSAGLSKEIKAKADSAISFSKLTFPHQLFRLILLEQIYRSCKINRNETYHK